MDKIDMSLDDIIKLNKKLKKSQTAATRGGVKTKRQNSAAGGVGKKSPLLNSGAAKNKRARILTQRNLKQTLRSPGGNFQQKKQQLRRGGTGNFQGKKGQTNASKLNKRQKQFTYSPKLNNNQQVNNRRSYRIQQQGQQRRNNLNKRLGNQAAQGQAAAQSVRRARQTLTNVRNRQQQGLWTQQGMKTRNKGKKQFNTAVLRQNQTRQPSAQVQQNVPQHQRRQNNKRRSWGTRQASNNTLLTVNIANDFLPRKRQQNPPGGRKRLNRGNLAPHGSPSLAQQIQALKPAVSENYKFVSTDFSIGTTKVSLTERFAGVKTTQPQNQQIRLTGVGRGNVSTQRGAGRGRGRGRSVQQGRVVFF